ncbi:hypothetical protein VB780_23685 [Leptolyngbya sp. CCNP1308]|uniref:hypothetical protein n=1 Tax=Leptolyngbya sp. CCNP1308 TaxID=3110255 RepID=UPI002B1F77E1|nr:hypothetical protein [Leptolyngbya sp. CCNP1308]MEA5451599.1 hypothetical protein [Leptolyngbya sp. CCNP1308]
MTYLGRTLALVPHRQLTGDGPGPRSPRILVTANRLRLAALLEKALCRQGWWPTVAPSPHAVVEAMRQATFDQILLDADHFQADLIPLVAAVDRRRSEVIVLAQDYCVGGFNLRSLVPAQDIFLKPFSTQHLVGVLKQRQAQRLYPSAIGA